LPAASQGPIEIDEGEQFLQAQLGLGQLSLKQVELGAENLQVGTTSSAAFQVAEVSLPSSLRNRKHSSSHVVAIWSPF
jgi:hypothetical protein